jgi:D-alanyl-D-alanine carboxypeptidase
MKIFGFRGACAIATLATGLLATSPAAQASRYADIIVDVQSGRIVRSQDADSLRYPASLTKMMTLYLTFDELKAGRLRLDKPLVASDFAAAQSPTSMGLQPGDVISVEEAIYALAVKSANDASVVLAEALAGSEPAFAERMTRRARELGMRSTTFRNASGLPDPRQQTTARDMAALGLALLRDHPDRYHYFAAPGFYFRGKLVQGHNRLNAWYEGADGIKTGFIRASGFNLVTSAERGGKRLVGVVLGGVTAADRDRRMGELLDNGFERLNGGEVRLANFSLIGSAQAAPHKAPPAATSRAEPAAVKAPPAGRRIAAATANGSWAIQVGAFDRAASAQEQLAIAQRLIGDLGTPSVTPIRVKTKEMHRARFTGLDEKQARDACTALAKRKQTCAVLPPSAAQS